MKKISSALYKKGVLNRDDFKNNKKISVKTHYNKTHKFYKENICVLNIYYDIFASSVKIIINVFFLKRIKQHYNYGFWISS